jgi:hypothetical protein
MSDTLSFERLEPERGNKAWALGDKLAITMGGIRLEGYASRITGAGELRQAYLRTPGGTLVTIAFPSA